MAMAASADTPAVLRGQLMQLVAERLAMADEVLYSGVACITDLV